MSSIQTSPETSAATAQPLDDPAPVSDESVPAAPLPEIKIKRWIVGFVILALIVVAIAIAAGIARSGHLPQDRPPAKQSSYLPGL